MKCTVVLLIIFVLPPLTVGQHKLFGNKLEWQSVEMLEGLLGMHKKAGGATGRLARISWKKCNQMPAVVDIKSISISPDPLHFPGSLTVATAFDIKKPLSQPLKGALDIQMKVGSGYISIPCIDNYGSCTYDDLCELLAPVAPNCPDPLVKIGLGCKCPFKAKSYTLKKTSFDVATSIIPSGEYNITANITHSSTEILCLNLNISVD